MLEIGHILGLRLLNSKCKKPVKVTLVVANTDLVSYYKNLFSEKQALADPLISFEWLNIAVFKQLLADDSAKNSVADAIIVDEGDLLLEREVNLRLNLSCPKHLILLSAVPKEGWSGS